MQVVNTLHSKNYSLYLHKVDKFQDIRRSPCRSLAQTLYGDFQADHLQVDTFAGFGEQPFMNRLHVYRLCKFTPVLRTKTKRSVALSRILNLEFRPLYKKVPTTTLLLCFVGYIQTIPGVETPGSTLQITPGCSTCMRLSYPYPDLLQKLHSRAHDTPGTLLTCVIYIRPCHKMRNFLIFCKTFATIPETPGSSSRLPYPYP